MNPHNHLDDSSILNAEIAEERELQRVLERTRLEEAAARPISLAHPQNLWVDLGSGRSPS